MIHFSCDRCHRTIEEEELRFRVSIEIQVALDGSDFETENVPQDDMDVLHEVLEQFDEAEREEISQFAYQQQQYDLCSDCHREYLKNPLSHDPHSRVGFSEN